MIVIKDQPSNAKVVIQGSKFLKIASVPSTRLKVVQASVSGGDPPSLVFDFGSPSSSWIVNHNMARSPSSVRVLSIGGVEVEAQVTETSTNQLVVQFSSPQVGRVVVK